VCIARDIKQLKRNNLLQCVYLQIIEIMKCCVAEHCLQLIKFNGNTSVPVTIHISNPRDKNNAWRITIISMITTASGTLVVQCVFGM
jgi:hypothetical protein